jgi:hypothetical protein
MLHVWFCSYKLLTRRRQVYSIGTEINLQMDWMDLLVAQRDAFTRAWYEIQQGRLPCNSQSYPPVTGARSNPPFRNKMVATCRLMGSTPPLVRNRSPLCHPQQPTRGSELEDLSRNSRQEIPGEPMGLQFHYRPQPTLIVEKVPLRSPFKVGDKIPPLPRLGYVEVHLGVRDYRIRTA